MAEASLRQLKILHLKRKADSALQTGNFREAYQRYTEAIQISVSKEGLHKLYSNRSLAYARAYRYTEALADADMCIQLCPLWPKGFWRRGMACLGLRLTSEAIQAFAQCWHLDHGSPDVEKQLYATIQRATVEQLGAGVISLLKTSEQQHMIEQAKLEAVEDAEQQEAWFRHLSQDYDGFKQVEIYQNHYFKWLKQPMSAHTAYIQRACMGLQTKCYLQARWDCKQAIKLLLPQLQASTQQAGSADSCIASAVEAEAAEAFWRLGQALAAEQGHPDQDHMQASKALCHAVDLAPQHKQIAQELQEVKSHLTLEQLAQVAEEVYEESAQMGMKLRAPLAHGVLASPQDQQHIFRLETNIWFPQVAKPKLDMVVPYKQYKLVRADGNVPERVTKHPFCMSRVHYSAADLGEEVWAEAADGSCRWRQTSAALTVACLKVPVACPAAHLQVTIQPYNIKVMNRMSGEVYLEGQLERGVVTEESVWEHGGGTGQDACLLHLHKMNLELLRKQWQHSEMWWPRLLRHHQPIQWDDYDKDYSDLPSQVMREHVKREAIQDADRQLESSEQQERARLQEKENQRRLTRQERLMTLRNTHHNATGRGQTQFV